MNLAPSLCDGLRAKGVDAVHWSEVGDPRAPDREILGWARRHGYAVLTHDLDFSAILAQTSDTGPSVIQLRTPDVLEPDLATLVMSIVERHGEEIGRGAIVTVDLKNARIRILPIPG